MKPEAVWGLFVASLLIGGFAVALLCKDSLHSAPVPSAHGRKVYQARGERPALHGSYRLHYGKAQPCKSTFHRKGGFSCLWAGRTEWVGWWDLDGDVLTIHETVRPAASEWNPAGPPSWSQYRVILRPGEWCGALDSGGEFRLEAIPDGGSRAQPEAWEDPDDLRYCHRRVGPRPTLRDHLRAWKRMHCR